jgi:hypothetical protein
MELLYILHPEGGNIKLGSLVGSSISYHSPLQESLASSFESVNLFQDALWQYDELETSFYQVLKEKNLSWFGSLITPHAKDDSAPLLSINKKPYRDLILANTISVFDFRIYLLSRQCALLGKMGRIVDIGKKSGAFLGAFGRRLREAEVGLSPRATCAFSGSNMFPAHAPGVFRRIMDIFVCSKCC